MSSILYIYSFKNSKKLFNNFYKKKAFKCFSVKVAKSVFVTRVMSKAIIYKFFKTIFV